MTYPPYYPAWPSTGTPGPAEAGYGAGWPTPAWPHSPAAPAQAVPGAKGLVLALVGGGGLLVGAVVGALLVTLAFSSSAREMGREMGEGYAAGLEDSFAGGVVGALPPGEVEQSDPVAPGDLGPDPVLDQYAQSCFAGDLQACDDLFFASPPLSAYEEYASSCGGRVKVYSVMACTDLE
jgi:hypothetical protein